LASSLHQAPLNNFHKISSNPLHTATPVDVPSIGKLEHSLHPIDNQQHNDSNSHIDKLYRSGSGHVWYTRGSNIISLPEKACLAPESSNPNPSMTP